MSLQERFETARREAEKYIADQLGDTGRVYIARDGGLVEVPREEYNAAWDEFYAVQREALAASKASGWTSQDEDDNAIFFAPSVLRGLKNPFDGQ